MRPLGLFWRAFTTLGCMGHSREGWRKHFGPDADVGAPFLRPMGKIASTYPCDPRCPMGHMRRVVEHGEDFFRAVCLDGKCAKVDLRREDVVAFEVDLEALGRAVLPALEMTPRAPVGTPSHRTWHIGTYASTDGLDVPVIVSTAVMPYETKTCLGELILGRMAPFILLIARPETLDLESASILKREGCAAVILQDVVGVDEAGRFHASRPVKAAIEAQLGEARPHPVARSVATPRVGVADPHSLDDSKTLPRTAPAIAPARAREENIFRSEGEAWMLKYEAKTSLALGTKGLSYVRLLLREPHRRFHAAQLHAAVAGEEHVPVLGSAGEVLDRQAMAEYREQLRELADEAAEAAQDNDLSRRDAIEEQRRALVCELSAATGLGGRQRKASDDVGRVRRSISMAITRDVERLAALHPTLARHLDTSIEKGEFFSYSPECDVTWTT